MHVGVVEHWLSGLTEREFDEPFVWLLRGHGFYDIHFTHGAFEFGKDFVAKRNEPDLVQYAFQSKAGDIGGAEWTEILGQIEELIAPLLAHPNFDRAATRKHVLLTTGILKGKAVLSTTAFRDQVAARGDGTFLVWDKDVLAEMLLGSPQFPLRPNSSIDVLLGEIACGSVTDKSIEAATATFVRAGESRAFYWRALADTHLCARLLVQARRPFSALTALLSLVRVAACAVQAAVEGAELMLRSALNQYASAASGLIAPFVSSASDPREWAIALGSGPGAIVTYSVACSRVLETLGLIGLIRHATGNTAAAKAAAATIATVVANQPGAVRPVSDRYATSLAPALLLLHAVGDSTSVLALLRGTTKWLCDRLDNDGVGLASAYATPEEEVQLLLGGNLDFLPITRRSESLLGLVLADLAYNVCTDLYPAIVNDLLAVQCVPTGLHVSEAIDAMKVSCRSGTTSVMNPKYPSSASAAMLAHHALQASARGIETPLGCVVPLALACLLRDRPYFDVYPRAARLKVT